MIPRVALQMTWNMERITLIPPLTDLKHGTDDPYTAF
jgi:hypothetical protein